ncbi:hypothetical protein M433DRAFT_427038 [Acidomyces richmondensis BFW]|nr:hypothetical protein M433DRAFT_427038 [Acidomyces richmondensis BFW]
MSPTPPPRPTPEAAAVAPPGLVYPPRRRPMGSRGRGLAEPPSNAYFFIKDTAKYSLRYASNAVLSGYTTSRKRASTCSDGARLCARQASGRGGGRCDSVDRFQQSNQPAVLVQRFPTPWRLTLRRRWFEHGPLPASCVG